MKGFKKEELIHNFGKFFWSYNDKKTKAFKIAEQILEDYDEKYQQNCLFSFDFDASKAYVKISYYALGQVIIMEMDGYVLLKGKLSPEEIQSIRDSVKVLGT